MKRINLTFVVASGLAFACFGATDLRELTFQVAVPCETAPVLRGPSPAVVLGSNILVAPFAHGHAEFPLEKRHQIAGVGESARIRDFCNGQFGVAQSALDFFETDSRDCLKNCFMLELLKSPVRKAA